MKDLITVDHNVTHRLWSEHEFALIAPQDLEHLPNSIAVCSTAPPSLKGSGHLFPSLVQLADIPASKRHSLQSLEQHNLDAGLAPICAALLSSKAQLKEVAGHLSRIQLVNSAAGERAWLRVHDSRVFLQLLRVLSTPRQVNLFGPITSWTVHWCSQWHTQSKPHGHAKSAPLDQKAWQAVDRIGIVNRTLGRLDEVEATPIQWDDLSKSIDALVQRATSHHGISALEDLVEFAYRGMTVSASFDDHPEVSQLIKSSGIKYQSSSTSERSTLADLFSLQSDVFWNKVRTATITSKGTL